MNRTGLAMETAAMASDKSGVRVLSRNVGGVGITDVRVSETAQRLGKPAGRYITLEGEPDAQSMTALLKRAIEQVIPRQGRLFAAGLGNPDITQDSLGALSVRSMAAREPGCGIRYSLAAIETDIAVRTGIDTVRRKRDRRGLRYRRGFSCLPRSAAYRQDCSDKRHRYSPRLGSLGQPPRAVRAHRRDTRRGHRCSHRHRIKQRYALR